MYVVYVTGGLASGKGTVCEFLGSLGATVFDLDTIAKEQLHDPYVLEQIVNHFGAEVLDETGSINRQQLAATAFVSTEQAAKLNSICWPPTMSRLADLLVGGSCQRAADNDLYVIEFPLFVESGADRSLADEVICVAADEGIRRLRARNRGMSSEDISNRLALQATDEQRISASDTVFTNNESLAALKLQVLDWYDNRHNRLELL
jgi:dephospho-CoA kinase